MPLFRRSAGQGYPQISRQACYTENRPLKSQVIDAEYRQQN